MDPNLEGLIRRCQNLLDDGRLDLRRLRHALSETTLPDEAISAHTRTDAERPYGRQVVFADANLELMLASWTPGLPCAPHDHGGSLGGVRVLRGAALHRVWHIAGGRLHLVSEKKVPAGGVLTCDADLVHSMVDAGDSEPLVTLHLYHGPIDFMVVYDLEADETLIVEGTCGAWVPTDAPHLIRARIPGIAAPAELETWSTSSQACF